ncbi:MAG: hypothetical protein V8S34_03115 [Lawsonibacter sp.]
MMQTIVVKNSIRRKFQDFWDRGRVLFLSAPCGFGKTTLAQTLLDGKRVLALTPDQPDFSLPPQSQDWEVLLLDDAQLMQEEEQWQALCTLIRTSPQRRFVVLSRGAPPGCLMAFRYAGLMTVLEPDDLLFGREDIRQLFQQEGVAVTDSEVSGILKESIGYPLGVAVTARNMAGGTPFSARTLCPSPFGRSSSISRRPSIAASTCTSAAFCWRWPCSTPSTWRWPGWSAATPTPGSCWTGSSGTPPCSGMTASSASTSGPSSGPSSCGRWTGNIPRRSAGPCSAGADCITS